MEIISNLSNSQAGVVDIIQTEYRKHWTRGLRQAELIIIDKRLTIAKNVFNHKENLQKIGQTNRLLKNLDWISKRLSWIPWAIKFINYLENNIHEELAVATLENSKFQFLLRDCQMELATAEAQKEQILLKHPEAQQLNFMDLQKKYGHEALISQKRACIQPEILSLLYGLPPSVGKVLFESSPEDQSLLLREIQELKVNHSHERSVKLMTLINSIPPERQEVYIGLLSSEINLLLEGENNA